MSGNGTDKNNVVDFAKLKKLRRTAMQKKMNGKPPTKPVKGKFGVWTYVQFFVLLGLVAFLMSRCQ